jgi:hypothetical protein
MSAERKSYSEALGAALPLDVWKASGAFQKSRKTIIGAPPSTLGLALEFFDAVSRKR